MPEYEHPNTEALAPVANCQLHGDARPHAMAQATTLRCVRGSVGQVAPGNRASGVEGRQQCAASSACPAAAQNEAWPNNAATTLGTSAATKKCSWLALRAAVLRLAVSSLPASPVPNAVAAAPMAAVAAQIHSRPCIWSSVQAQSNSSLAPFVAPQPHTTTSSHTAFTQLLPAMFIVTAVSPPNPSLKRSANGSLLLAASRALVPPLAPA